VLFGCSRDIVPVGNRTWHWHFTY